MTVDVLVATSEPDNRERFGDAFHEVADVNVVAFADRPADVEKAIARHVPDVVVLDDTLQPESALEVARTLLSRDPSTAVLLWTSRETPEALSDALDVGMRGVLTRPLSVDDATAKIVAAAQWSQRVRGNTDLAQIGGTGLTVALFGAKGGVGTSAIAIQLARMATRPGWPCVLVDFDLASGDLTSLLDLSHQRSVLDLVPVASHLNTRYLADALYLHPSGLRVLPGPQESERSDELTEPIARRILSALSSHFPVVVIDCGARLDDATAVALEIADHALLVVVPEVPCLLAARRHIATFSRLNIRGDERITAVVNRQSKRSELHLPDIRRTLEIRVADTVVPDREAAFYSVTNDARPLEDRTVLRPLRKLAGELGLLPSEDGAGPDARLLALPAGPAPPSWVPRDQDRQDGEPPHPPSYGLNQRDSEQRSGRQAARERGGPGQMSSFRRSSGTTSGSPMSSTT